MNPDQIKGAPASPFPDLQKYYDIAFKLPTSQAGIKVLTGQDQAREEQRQFDTQQQLRKTQQKLTGEGYQRIPKNDGGYTFLDNEGNEISASEYARATGKSVFDVLADSQNPVDIGFREDFANLEELMQAATTGDSEKLEAFYDQREDLRGMSPSDLLSRFRAAYPTVYGTQGRGQQVGSTLIPRLYDFRRGQGSLSVGD